MVRAPALPVETLDRPPAELLRDPYVKLALSIASTSLVEALEAHPLGHERSRRLLRPLLSYLVRMSSRPTPFGLFAGVARGEWGDRTELDLGGRPSIRRARPDMGWLYALMRRFERDPAVRANLVLRTHPSVRVRGGRAAVVGLDAEGSATGAAAVSVRATAVVHEALELCRDGARYREVERALCAEAKRDPANARRVLDALCEHGFLVTSLRPALSGSPAADLVGSLRGAGGGDGAEGAPAVSGALARFIDELAGWEKLHDAEALRSWRRLTEMALRLEPTGPAIQVDARFGAPAVRLPRSVALEAARAVDLLHRLSPAPAGPTALDRWREGFEADYGHGRPVPVLELLDRGLPELTHAPTQRSARDRILLEVAGAALHADLPVVELDEERIAELESAGGPRGRPPPSVDLFCSVAATSTAELDAGRFRLVVGDAVAPAARSFGRFAYLFDEDELEFLGEAPAAAPRTIAAEMLFEPLWTGSGNVMIRPLRASHVIHLGGALPGGAARTIPLDELAVTLAGSSLRLVWPSEGVQVAASCSHMLSYRLAPRLAAFLHAVSSDGETVVGGFSWGSAEHLPALPRLQAGRVVLRRAEWTLDRSFLDAYRRDGAAALHEAALPRSVLLGEHGGGEHLLLDLETERGATLLLAAGDRLRAGERTRVLEALPGPEHAFARSSDGHRPIELAVPVVAPRSPDDAPSVAVPPAIADRQRPPGTEWLYAKLYTAADAADELIAGPLRALTRELSAGGRVSSWFFARYADPAFHLRLRLCGDPATLTGFVFREVCDWARELMDAGLVQRFAFDTYERETERYGGPLALPLAERVFAADSVAAAELIAQRPAIVPEIDWTHLGVMAVDDLLDALGLDPEARLAWYRENHDVYEQSRAFRAAKETLRALVGGSADGSRARATVHGILGARRAALEEVGSGLAELSRRDALWTPLPDIARSLVHMHCNRLHTDGREAEPAVLGLAGLTAASVLAAPPRREPERTLDTGTGES
jgi:thiopeptide-type bacteriocin biosynthesis protein